MLRRLTICVGLIVASAAIPAVAGYPVLSLFTRQANGPYAPSVGRYLIVDPTPVGMYAETGHGSPAVERELWQRRDLNRATYPYGWFGAAEHSTQRWTNSGYYDNYVEGRTLRGR